MAMAVSQTASLRQSSRGKFGIASLGIRESSSFTNQEERIKKWRCGVVRTEQGRLCGIVGRWWAYQGNILQTWWDLRWRPLQQDRCDLYYSQPWSSPGFLTLSYVRSGPRTSLSTFYAATLALDQIARLKDSNAIVCHVTNDRISDRLLARWGWEKHCLDWPGRHFIKRFYGNYPEIDDHWRKQLRM